MLKSFFAGCVLAVTAVPALAVEVGGLAPNFDLKKQDGTSFSLASRQGKGWTVLYFYPKAGTPGCTKQACAFRDSVNLIRDQNAEVYGISADTVANQAKFHKQHSLNFTLLADPDAKTIEAYGVKMPLLAMSKRWTIVVDPELKIRAIEKDVDPALDAERVAKTLKDLQAKK